MHRWDLIWAAGWSLDPGTDDMTWCNGEPQRGGVKLSQKAALKPGRTRKKLISDERWSTAIRTVGRMTIRHSGSGRSWNRDSSPQRRDIIAKLDEINSQIAKLHNGPRNYVIGKVVAKQGGGKALRRSCLDSFTVGSRAKARYWAKKPEKQAFDLNHSQGHERGVLSRNSQCDNDHGGADDVGPSKANHVSGDDPPTRWPLTTNNATAASGTRGFLTSKSAADRRANGQLEK
ncbi:uncharacterized protein Triagg1_6827 [Trichoderma aggressivum f. europaeum]|uniref:Uncharacterized protein n=1 Tax=Trichoderma aggressivum f. europaeum TaxID=173218 RepID=A0AAE1J3E4_9HYPO|nr:hypothetical protein Triagg1_6827 [Trichoderma aggressivum f. europaeum]